MKRIITNGITNLEPLPGSSEWYWGMDYTGGDLYEADELYRDGHPIRCNRCILVHYPDGTVYEPVRAKHGQYLGKPAYCDGEEIHILTFDEAIGKACPLAVVPLSIVDDCYNLMLKAPPFMLTRSAHDNTFQIVWPERRDFAVEDNEYFAFLDGSKMYTWAWYEDPDYREEVLVRDFRTGKVLERIPGRLRSMPDGQNWVLV